jgi:acyl carrier protein
MDRVSWLKIENRVKEIVSEQIGLNLEEVRLESKFTQDLGADSLAYVELIMALEDEYKIDIPLERAERITAVSDIMPQLVELMPEEMRDKIDRRVIAFRIREDGRIEVGMRFSDGTWTFADGTSLLPSGIYLTVFSKWGDVLKDLEDIINDPHSKEKDLQLFFEQYPDLLKGDEYDIVIPQACIIPDQKTLRQKLWRADFMLSPIDQTNFCKILELKLPEERIVRSDKSGHQRFYQWLWEAISQIRDYGEAFNSSSTRTRFSEMYKIDVLKPDLQLVAGRKWNMVYTESMLELQRRNLVKIDDWDTHLERLRRKFT